MNANLMNVQIYHGMIRYDASQTLAVFCQQKFVESKKFIVYIPSDHASTEALKEQNKLPVTGTGYCECYCSAIAGYMMLMYYAYSGVVYYRRLEGGNWTSWEKKI